MGGLKCQESHYGRLKSVRGYLPPELSVKKLWRKWKTDANSNGLKVCSYSKFFKLFNHRFNLAFGDPKTDICLFCEECKLTIQSATDTKVKLKP